MKPVFVIPARGGSKGIPGKNIKPLCGKPLIAYSVEVARQLADDRDICVTTDDERIAQVVKNMGLDVPFMRPDYLATDGCGTYEVLLHAVKFYEELGRDYDTLVLLQPTSPMRTAEDVQAAIDAYTPDIDMVVTVTEAASNPYYNCYETDENGFLHISKGDGCYTRRQDAPKAWEYNSAVYESLKKGPLGSFRRRKMVEMSRERSVDLDTPLDWMVAEAIMSGMKQ